MLTIFTTPKPFQGHIDVIQRNALRSWTMLEPRPEIIVFGDEPGAAEVSRGLGFRHEPAVVRNEHGTPLVNDLFARAEELGNHKVMAYVNADIILMSDFMTAVMKLSRKRRFLMVGQRWDLDVTEPIEFRGEWRMHLREKIAEVGQLHPSTGIDYFVFRRGLWGEIPPFAIGRTCWDNWFIYRARAQGAAVIDATKAVTAIHQNHDYSHLSVGTSDPWNGVEAAQNLELAGGYDKILTLEDANWLLTPDRLTRAPWTRQRIRRIWENTPVLFPRLALVPRLFRAARRRLL
jgi:hypothetical protein